MRVDEIVKSRLSKWAYISDGEPFDWHYSFVALVKMGNDYAVLVKTRPLFAKGYEFAYDERMRAITYYNEFERLMETDDGLKHTLNIARGIITEKDKVITPRMVSLGYLERDSDKHPRLDNKDLIQLYEDEERGIGNKEITIEPFEIRGKAIIETKKKEPKYEEYEQVRLFI